MATFDSYKKDKLSNPEFKKRYTENCPICTTTVRIIDHMHRLGYSREKVAEIAGIDVRQLIDLEDAEHCDVEIVKKLWEAFNIEMPLHCTKIRDDVS